MFMKSAIGMGLLLCVTLGWVVSAADSSLDFSPMIIFGEDNRQEVFSISPQWQKISQSIAGKVSLEHLHETSDGFELVGIPLSKRECPDTRFNKQILVPSCTGFLAKPNILITAGHCIKSQEDCDQFVWVFGYALQSDGDLNYTKISSQQVYRCKKIHNRRFENFGAVDYAIIELDRPVVDREPLTLGFDTVLTPGMSVTSIGHPLGLPLKFIDSATIIQLSDENRTIDTNLDVFQGNSGSPVFDAATGAVISITSHGHADHTRDPEKLCKVPKVCMPGDNCYWSSSSRITNLKDEPALLNQ